jgi:hypothetical protein
MNNVCHKYTLIPSETTDGYPLHRLPFPTQPGESQEAVIFSYPFADFNNARMDMRFQYSCILISCPSVLRYLPRWSALAKTGRPGH